MIAVIFCDYDEGNLGSYRGCGVRVHGQVKHFSSTGDFRKDLVSCASYCVREKLRAFFSSSVDSIQMERHQEWKREGQK